MAQRRQGGSGGPCVTLGMLKLIKAFEWRRQQLKEAVPSWKTAFSVTCCQGGNGSKGTKEEGKCLRPVITPSYPFTAPFRAVCVSGQLFTNLGSSPAWRRLLTMLWKVVAVPRTLPLSTQSEEWMALEARGGVQRPAAPSSSAVMQPAGSDCSYCKDSLWKKTKIQRKTLNSKCVSSALGYVPCHGNLALTPGKAESRVLLSCTCGFFPEPKAWLCCPPVPWGRPGPLNSPSFLFSILILGFLLLSLL